MAKQTEFKRVCAFCGKGEADGRKLITPPNAPEKSICIYCLRAANLHLEAADKTPPEKIN